MSHLDVDVIDFVLLTIYPVGGIFIVEMICRAAKITTWVKYVTQGLVSIGFGVAYVTIITAHWLTAIVLFALAVALFYQARRLKIDPTKTPF